MNTQCAGCLQFLPTKDIRYHNVFNNWCKTSGLQANCSCFQTEVDCIAEQSQTMLDAAIEFMESPDFQALQQNTIKKAVSLLGLQSNLQEGSEPGFDEFAELVASTMNGIGVKNYAVDGRAVSNGVEHGKPAAVHDNKKHGHLFAPIDVCLVAVAARMRNFTSWASIESSLTAAAVLANNPEISACKLPQALHLPQIYKTFRFVCPIADLRSESVNVFEGGVRQPATSGHLRDQVHVPVLANAKAWHMSISQTSKSLSRVSNKQSMTESNCTVTSM